jgi:hypothetical protein
VSHKTTESRKFRALKGIGETNKKGKECSDCNSKAGTEITRLGISGTPHKPRASIFGFS